MFHNALSMFENIGRVLELATHVIEHNILKICFEVSGSKTTTLGFETRWSWIRDGPRTSCGGFF